MGAGQPEAGPSSPTTRRRWRHPVPGGQALHLRSRFRLCGRWGGRVRTPGSGAPPRRTPAAGSLELRLPVTSPPSLGKLGVRAFIDAATVYDAGAHLRRQHFERGAGGGVWFTATVIRLAFQDGFRLWASGFRPTSDL